MSANWKPIETAPFDEWVLVWGGSYVGMGFRQIEAPEDWIDEACAIPKIKFTHWAALPEPPNA